MKLLLLFFALQLCALSMKAQLLWSGNYDFGLKLAYDSTINKLTGFYENATGWDEQTQSPRFLCSFYFEGNAALSKFKIISYFPKYKFEDTIQGTFEIVNNGTVKIKLYDDHGGCWNVQHFMEEPVVFKVENKHNWQQIRYITSEKSYFFAEKANNKSLHSYVVKFDIVCVERIDGAWAYCIFYGEKTTKGWIKASDLNSIE